MTATEIFLEVTALVGRVGDMRQQELKLVSNDWYNYAPAGYRFFIYTDLYHYNHDSLSVYVAREHPGGCPRRVRNFSILKKLIRPTDTVFIFRAGAWYPSILTPYANVVNWLPPEIRRDVVRDEQRYMSAMEKLEVPEEHDAERNDVEQGDALDDADYY